MLLFSTKYEGGEPSRVGNRASPKRKSYQNSINFQLNVNPKVGIQSSCLPLESIKFLAPPNWWWRCCGPLKCSKIPYTKMELITKIFTSVQPQHEQSHSLHKICSSSCSIDREAPQIPVSCWCLAILQYGSIWAIFLCGVLIQTDRFSPQKCPKTGTFSLLASPSGHYSITRYLVWIEQVLLHIRTGG